MFQEKFKKAVAKVAKNIPVWRELIQIKEELREIRRADARYYYHQELEKSRHCLDHRVLYQYGFQVNSQNDEDGIIREIFRRINVTDRTFVEIGVEDGFENNTAFLLTQGWKGFWIDGRNAFQRTLHGRKDLQNGCLRTHVEFVTKENVAGIFEKLKVPKNFDLLSLDIDQNTYYIWEALGEHSPRVVVVEYNSILPPDVDWKVEYARDRAWDRTQNYGASLKALEKLGQRLGYSLVGCDFIGINAFFVRNDLVADKFFAPFTAENHYQPFRYPYIHRKGHPKAILDRSV